MVEVKDKYGKGKYIKTVKDTYGKKLRMRMVRTSIFWC